MTPRKPRKKPKNQRAYPKKDKPRLVEVYDAAELKYLLDHQEDIGVPQLYTVSSTEHIFYAVNSNTMRKWRAFKNTSGAVE